MDEFDILAPQFRRATERWPDAPTLTSHYQAVVETYSGSGLGLIATIKSFVECVCLTILNDFGKTTTSSTPSTTEMLREALKCLGLENTHGASKFGSLLSAHNKLADALSDIRNSGDPIAHGKDGFLDTLTLNERRAFLITSDTILALLLAAYDGTEPDLQYTRAPYDRFMHLHDRVDQSVYVEAKIVDEDDRQIIALILRTQDLPDGFELRVEPSRLLYVIDRTAYVEILSTAVAMERIESKPVDSETGPSEGEKAPIPVSSEKAIILVPTEKAIMLLPSEPKIIETKVSVIDSLSTYLERKVSTPEAPLAQYEGRLSTLKGPLTQYVTSLGVVQLTRPDGTNLVDSMLANVDSQMRLDWEIREDSQSAIKVALKRTLVQFDNSRELAETISEQLVPWLNARASKLTGPDKNNTRMYP